MKTLIATNNLVTISFAQAVLKDIGIEPLLMDTAMSSIEGSIGIIPRRLIVVDEDEAPARRALIAAGLEHELEPL